MSDRRNICVVVLDTFRYDLLFRNQTSTISTYAEEGVQFTNAYTTYPQTKPAHMSLFTGLWAGEHLAIDNATSVDTDFLPTVLRDRGYNTYGAVGIQVLDEAFGFDEGFDRYEKADSISSPAIDVFDLVADDLGEPMFLFLNLVDTHDPLVYPSEFETAGRARHLLDRGWSKALRTLDYRTPLGVTGEWRRHMPAAYYSAAAYLDQQLATIVDRLPEDTTVIITADHGEAFGEHPDTYYHGVRGWLYDETTHIPLIVHETGEGAPFESTTVDSVVSLKDVYDLVLGLADGQSELPGREFALMGLAPMRTESRYYELSERYRKPYRAIVTREAKLVEGPDELYLFKDGDEYRDRAGDEDLQQVQQDLYSILQTQSEFPLDFSRDELSDVTGVKSLASESDDLENKLRDLGYLE